jgi:hypothetical protein
MLKTEMISFVEGILIGDTVLLCKVFVEETNCCKFASIGFSIVLYIDNNCFIFNLWVISIGTAYVGTVNKLLKINIQTIIL